MSDLMDRIITEAERHKAGINPQDFLKNWLGDFSKVIKQHELIDEEFQRLKALPGIFCCNCGSKIYTKLTPVEYLEQNNCDLILCGHC